MATDIEPPPDYAMIAAACGALGVTLRDPDEVEAGLRAAVAARPWSTSSWRQRSSTLSPS